MIPAQSVFHQFIDSTGKALDWPAPLSVESSTPHRITETMVQIAQAPNGEQAIVFTHRVGYMVQS